jgi:DNA invertase Pin-like site-specific DNA recombinase
MKYVAYYRVSTEEQGTSGLGLKAQATSVLNYISQSGELVGEFQDIESGASESRQGMVAAIEACKIHKAILVVKEMSRISRGGFKYRQLMEDSKVDFIECNSPHDPEFVKDIKFSLAKDERKKIRQRTKDALGEIKLKIERGETHVSKAGNIVTALGNPDNLSDKARAISIAVRKDKAMNDENNVRAGAFIIALADSNNFKQITQKLNAAGFKTSRGNDFSEMQAKRLYNRYKENCVSL